MFACLDFALICIRSLPDRLLAPRVAMRTTSECTTSLPHRVSMTPSGNEGTHTVKRVLRHLGGHSQNPSAGLAGGRAGGPVRKDIFVDRLALRLLDKVLVRLLHHHRRHHRY